MAAFLQTVSVLLVVHALPRILLLGDNAAMPEGVVRGGTLLPRHVTEQARAYFGTKYNMLHFVGSKQSEWIATHTVTTFASIGNWVPISALVKGTPLKPRRCAVSDFESREYTARLLTAGRNLRHLSAFTAG